MCTTAFHYMPDAGVWQRDASTVSCFGDQATKISTGPIPAPPHSSLTQARPPRPPRRSTRPAAARLTTCWHHFAISRSAGIALEQSRQQALPRHALWHICNPSGSGTPIPPALEGSGLTPIFVFFTYLSIRHLATNGLKQ